MLSELVIHPSERVVCLIGYQNTFLVVKKKSDQWKLPGGSFRENEDFIQAIFRSVAEKTGIDLRKDTLTYFGKVNQSLRNRVSQEKIAFERDQILHVFHAVLKEEKPIRLTQEMHLRWVNKEQLEMMYTGDNVFSNIARFCEEPHQPETPSHGSRIVVNLLGTVGSGKGTQGKKLSENYHFFSLSLGDLYRAECREKTPIGNLIELHHEKCGTTAFAPNEIAYGLILKWMANPLCREGVVLDGFPRTAEQTVVYNTSFLRPTDNHIPIYLSVDEEDILQRLETRQICSNCGLQVRKEDHVQEDSCPSCKGALTRRHEDVSSEKLQQRLQFFKRQLPEVISAIALRDRVSIIHADPLTTPDDVFRRIDSLIQSKKPFIQMRCRDRND